LLDDPADFVFFRRVRLERDDGATGSVAEQVIPSVLGLATLPHGFVELEAVAELIAHRLVDVLAMAVLDGPKPIFHMLVERGRGNERGAYRSAGLRRPLGLLLAARHHSLSFTAMRTASPKRELNPVSPPQPDSRSSGDSGSRAEISVERTLPSSSKPRR